MTPPPLKNPGYAPELYGTSLKLKKIINRRSKTVLGLRTSNTFELRLYGVKRSRYRSDFLNAHGHFIITCLPPVFNMNENFLKKKK